jgi:hypothetical protein
VLPVWVRPPGVGSPLSWLDGSVAADGAARGVTNAGSDPIAGTVGVEGPAQAKTMPAVINEVVTNAKLPGRRMS